MRAMLSLTICGGLAAPWARTDGACAASASPTAVERTEAANSGCFMANPLCRSRSETVGDSTQRPEGYRALQKFIGLDSGAAVHTGKLQHSLDAVTNVQLAHDFCHVMLDGPLAAVEPPRDLFVGHSLRHKREDFFLVRSEIAEMVDDDGFNALATIDQHPP